MGIRLTEATKAWVLIGEKAGCTPFSDALEQKKITLPELSPESCLVETLYGSWEGNMDHALRADPVNICVQRKEPEVVLGNSAVVRVLAPGENSGLAEGDCCLIYGAAETDEYGYMTLALAYDAPATSGVLAKRLVIPAANLIPLPKTTRHDLERWAAFSIRYITAWGNLNVAIKAFRSQMDEHDLPVLNIGAWGGGTSYAEVTLAKLRGHAPFLVTSSGSRLEHLKKIGVTGIDRRRFMGLSFDEDRYDSDPDYHKAYAAREDIFLEAVLEATGGQGFHVIVDNIGTPIFRASLRSLARQGVFATSGWKRGMRTPLFRAIETIQRHIHIHTHYATRNEADESVSFAEENDWLPPMPARVWRWQDIPALADAYAEGDTSWFPVFSAL